MQNATKNDRRVVVTGIGPITYGCTGKEEFWNFLLKKTPYIEPIPSVFERTYNFKSRYYIPFPEITPEMCRSFKKYSKLIEKPAKLALIGTELALIDAGFKDESEWLTKSGLIANSSVILGIGICDLKAAADFYLFNVYGQRLEGFPEGITKPGFNRLVIPSVMTNSVSAWVSILFGIKGFNYTTSASCSSSTLAIGEAFQKIKNGYSDIVVSGGVECLQEEIGSIMKGFDLLGALTKSENGKPMPFSENRSGFLFSEGAGCILILEELETAKLRGAEIYAEIVDYKSNSDAFNIVQIQESGEQIKKLLTELIGSRKIDYLNAHGTATELNDRVEQQIIKEVFGKKTNQPIINSTKGLLGHSIGASGALEAAATALSVKHSKVHANLADNMFNDLNLVTDTTEVDINYAISTSYGFGGHNTALLFKKYSEV